MVLLNGGNSSYMLRTRTCTMSNRILFNYGLLLPLKSERLGQCNTKSSHVWKKNAIWMRLLTDQMFLSKICFFNFLLILGALILFKINVPFWNFSFNLCKNCEIIFTVFFLLQQLKKCELYFRLEIVICLSIVVSFLSYIFK